MKDLWIRIRKVTEDDVTSFEARWDGFPDASVYEFTADKAYENMRALIPEMTQHYIDVHGYVPWQIFEGSEDTDKEKNNVHQD